MNGLGLLIGHLIGDYIFQNDWMAANKVNSWPSGPLPRGSSEPPTEPDIAILAAEKEWHRWWKGHLACTVHCLLYTFAVALCSFWWMPWWGYVATFALHWPIDRFRLARLWMVHVSGQKAFATGPLSPWSIILVDNVFHLLTLFVIGVIHSCSPVF